jgi:hypothetical protein
MSKKEKNTQKEITKMSELMNQSKSPGMMMTGYNYDS